MDAERQKARLVAESIARSLDADTGMAVLSWSWSRDITRPAIVTITLEAAPRALAELTMALPATATSGEC